VSHTGGSIRTQQDKANREKAFYTSIVLYNGSLTATKLTFLLQYHRILGTTGNMRKAIVVAFVIVALWSISQLLVVIFTCTPIHKFWLPETPGTCIPNLPFWYVNAAGNIITDVIVFVLPLPAISRLNLRRGAKFGLIGVFCLGFFVSPSLRWHEPLLPLTQPLTPSVRLVPSR